MLQITPQNIKQATILLQRHEDIVLQIEQISQFANKIKDSHLSVSLKMSYDKPKNENVTFDPEGNMQYGTPKNRFLAGFLQLSSDETVDTEQFHQVTNEVVSLEILGIIVAHLEAEKMYIMSEIKKL